MATRRKPSLHTNEILKIQDSGPVGRFVGSQIRLTHIAALDALEADFAPYRSSPIRFAILDHLSELPGCTQATLAEILDVDRTTLVPILRSMERQGLIRRRQADHDKRAAQVYLAPGGVALIKKLRPLAAAHEKRMCAGMSESEKSDLIELLRRIRKNIQRR